MNQRIEIIEDRRQQLVERYTAALITQAMLVFQVDGFVCDIPKIVNLAEKFADEVMKRQKPEPDPQY